MGDGVVSSVFGEMSDLSFVEMRYYCVVAALGHLGVGDVGRVFEEMGGLFKGLPGALQATNRWRVERGEDLFVHDDCM